MSSNELLMRPFFTHEIAVRTEVDPEVLDAARKTVELVWLRNIGEPTHFRLVIGDRIVDADDNPIDASAQYEQSTDSILYGWEAIKAQFSGIIERDLSEVEVMTIVSAHEAMHRVQLHRGDTFKKHDDMTPEEYLNSPQETEAWHEAMHVLKYLHPENYYAIVMGGLKYESPAVSKYANLFPKTPPEQANRG